MKERTSRLLVAIEAVFLLVPLSLFAALLFTARAVRYADGNPFGLSGFTPAQDGVILACFAGLAAAWWLVAWFVLRGRAGLGRVGRVPRRIADVAALATVALAPVSLLSDAGVLPPHALGPATPVVFGLPVLVPYFHLAIERRRARRAPGQTHA